MTEVDSPTQPSSELVSARDLVRVRLLWDILHGEIEPLPTEGHPLTESSIMDRYGQTSRMPVRMALAVLAGEGLFRQRARYGYWLVQYDLDDVRQITRIRAGVEAMVADALCQRRMASEDTAADERSGVALWDSALHHHQAMGSLVEGRYGEVGKEVESTFADADTQFHVSLAQAGGYDIAARHIVEWRNQVRIFRLQHGIRYDFDALRAVQAEHSELIDAIGRADRESAAELARAHIERVLTRAQALVPEYA